MSNNNLKPEIFNRLIEAIWLSIIFFIPLLFNPFCMTAFYFVKSMALILLVSVMLGCFIARHILFPDDLKFQGWKGLIKRNPLQCTAVGMGLIWLISTIFSIMPHKSLLGNLAGTMGLFPALSWIIFFLIVSAEIKNSKQVFRAIYTLLISTGIVCVIGIVQFVYPVMMPWFNFYGSVFSTDGNPLSLSGMLALTMPVTLAMVIISWNKSNAAGNNRLRAILLIVLFILQLTCTALAQYSITMLLFVIGIFVFFTLIGLYLKSKTTFVSGIISLLAMVVIAVALVFPILFTPNPVVLSDKPEESPVVAEQVGLPTLSIRVHAWRSAADVIIKSPEMPLYEDKFKYLRRIIGYGPETFIAVSQLTFPDALKSMYTYKSLVISQPENHFLFLLAITGILGFCSFICLLAVFFYIASKWLIRTTDRNAGILAAAFIAAGIQYCAHIFFNPAVITVEMSFWLIATLTVACIKLDYLRIVPAGVIIEARDSSISQSDPRGIAVGKKVLSAMVIIIFVFTGLGLTLPPYLANLRAQEGLNLWETNHSQAMKKFEDAVRLQPEESYYYNFIGHLSFTQAMLSENNAEKEKLMESSETALKHAVQYEPQMAIWRYRLADQQLYQALHGSEVKMTDALESYEQASMLFPGNAVILDKWAIALIAAGKYDDAECILQKAQSADEKWVQTWFSIGLLKQHQDKEGNAGRYFVSRVDNRLENVGYFIRYCVKALLYGQMEDVNAALHKYTKDNNSDWTGWMLYGISNMYCSKYQESITSFEKAAEYVPDKHITMLAGIAEGMLKNNPVDNKAGHKIADKLMQKALNLK